MNAEELFNELGYQKLDTEYGFVYIKKEDLKQYIKFYEKTKTYISVTSHEPDPEKRNNAIDKQMKELGWWK